MEVVVGAATLIRPTLAGEISEECTTGGGNGSGCAATRLRSRYGSRLDRIAARESRKQAANLLIDFPFNSAAFGLGIRNELKHRAILNATAVTCALIDGRLQDVFFPSHDEITVSTIASRVTLRPDERLRVAVPLIRKLVGFPDNLIEEGNQVDWEVWRAGAGIIGVGRIRHMGDVVGRVEVLSIPAGWEKDLSTETIGAIVVGEVGCLGLAWSAIVETVVTDGLRSKIGASTSFEWIAGNHAESWRESLDLFPIASTLEVVHSRTAILLDTLKGSVLVLEEQSRGPVVAVVSHDSARRAGGGLGGIVVHGEIESISSHDRVQVVRHMARTDDRIGTLNDNRAFAR